MKFNTLTLLLFFLCFFGLVIVGVMELPQISLPKFAQHNTIGELPIVEMADDGVFAEIDGAEATYTELRKKDIARQAERRATRADRCYGVASSVCEYYYKNKTKRQVRREQRKYRKCIDRSYTKDGEVIFDGEGWPLDSYCRANDDYWGKPPVFKDSETCFTKARQICDAYNGNVRCDELSKLGLGLYTCWGTFK